MPAPDSKGYVLISTANGEITFRDRRGSWWHKLSQAHRYSSEREANVVAKNVKVAGLSVESVEKAAARDRNRKKR